MSTTPRHAADSHDTIRVYGARENDLKDVSIEIPTLTGEHLAANVGH